MKSSVLSLGSLECCILKMKRCTVHQVSGFTWKVSPVLKFLLCLIRRRFVILGDPWWVCWRWCYSFPVLRVFSTWPLLCFVSHRSLVRQAVCILLEKADCCENLCHINRNKALAHLDMIASNFPLITSGTQLHQYRHVIGKKYQLKNHLVKNEEYFSGWQTAKCQNVADTSALVPHS